VSAPLKIGLLGAGTVGTAVARLAASRPDLGIAVAGAFVRDVARPRPHIGRLTADPAELLRDPKIAVIVEVLGGEEPARSLILAALDGGKHVVTANKLVVATHWAELHQRARTAGRELRFEAAVGGAMPLVATLQELVANRPRSIRAILNGTTNFILSRMEDGGSDFDTALGEAQRAGYAEADPSSDVDGFDPAYKLAICVSLMTASPFAVGRVTRESMRGVTSARLREARGRGARLRYVASALFSDGSIEARVRLEEVLESSPLAVARGVENAVEIEADPVGRLALVGPGAGGDATASAIIADLVAISAS
jgi:homoserine dehydrogenase